MPQAMRSTPPTTTRPTYPDEAATCRTGALAATTLAGIAGHADPSFTFKKYARDGRDDAAVIADVLGRAAGAGFGA
jgi:hypothetical protein